MKRLEYVRKKSLEDPALSDGFPLEGAERYLDEVFSSHPEHRTPSCPEAEGVRSSGRSDYQHESGDQTKEQREPQSSADREAKSTADSVKARAGKPLPVEDRPARSKSDVTDATPDIDAEYALKTAFLNQQNVVEAMMDLERKLGIIAPAGYKQVDVLRKLAGAILKQELKRRK